MSEKEENVNDLYGMRNRIEDEKRRIKNDAGITPANKTDVLAFLEWCGLRGNKGRPLSIARVCIYAQRLLLLARMAGKTDFRTATKADLEGITEQIERRKTSAVSKNFLRITLKKLYSWLENGGEAPSEKLKWLHSKGGQEEDVGINPEDLLTAEEVRRLIDAGESERNKALIAVLAESGCRIGEMASMRIKNVSYDKFGARITVSGKTGRRTVRLLTSINYLTDWVKVHPHREESDAPLWCCLERKRGQSLPYNAYTALLRRIARRAGVTKRVNPHSFRHAAATRLASLGLSTVQMAGYLGWKADTNMAQTYIHLSGKNLDDALLKAYGLQERGDDGVERLKCRKCNTENEVTQRYCGKCGMPLTTTAAVSLNESDVTMEEIVAFMKEMQPYRQSTQKKNALLATAESKTPA